MQARECPRIGSIDQVIKSGSCGGQLLFRVGSRISNGAARIAPWQHLFLAFLLADANTIISARE